MFLTENIVLNDYSIKLKKKEINYNMIKNIMKPQGFIFK